MRKILYAWRVQQVNPGAGADVELVNGGYLTDPAIGAGSFPNAAGSYIASQGVAISQALAFLRRYQSAGRDCRARVYYKIFGTDVPNAVRALAAGEDNETEVCRLDAPERSVRHKVNLANRSTDPALAADEGDELPQDLDNPVGG